MTQSQFNRRMHIRESVEIVAVVSVAAAILFANQYFGEAARPWLVWTVVVFACLKTSYYFGESLWHLVSAAASDLAYHRFLTLMAYNMTEVTLSFAIDFFCLQHLDSASFSGLNVELGNALLLFDCFYFSVLNFSFFGYGDIIPATVPAKMVMLMEVITAFTTVIFLISDFVSMKESVRKSRSSNGEK
jgi:hypothetical protein